jgi:hypothetical protein
MNGRIRLIGIAMAAILTLAGCRPAQPQAAPRASGGSWINKTSGFRNAR